METAISYKDFNPDGTTGFGKPHDMLYRFTAAGPRGGHFELLLEPHHTDEDKKRAKKFLRDEQDVVSIKFVKLIGSASY